MHAIHAYLQVHYQEAGWCDRKKTRVRHKRVGIVVAVVVVVGLAVFDVVLLVVVVPLIEVAAPGIQCKGEHLNTNR